MSDAVIINVGTGNHEAETSSAEEKTEKIETEQMGADVAALAVAAIDTAAQLSAARDEIARLEGDLEKCRNELQEVLTINEQLVETVEALTSQSLTQAEPSPPNPPEKSESLEATLESPEAVNRPAPEPPPKASKKGVWI